jgi:hypothetical protein
MKDKTDQFAMVIGDRFSLPDFYIESLMRAQGELTAHPLLDQFAFLAQSKRKCIAGTE